MNLKLQNLTRHPHKLGHGDNIYPLPRPLEAWREIFNPVDPDSFDGIQWRQLRYLLSSGSVAVEADAQDWDFETFWGGWLWNITDRAIRIGDMLIPSAIVGEDRAYSRTGGALGGGTLWQDFSVSWVNDDTPQAVRITGSANDFQVTPAANDTSWTINANFPNTSTRDAELLIDVGLGTITVTYPTNHYGSPVMTTKQFCDAWNAQADAAAVATLAPIADTSEADDGGRFFNRTWYFHIAGLDGFACRDLQRHIAAGNVITDGDAENDSAGVTNSVINITSRTLRIGGNNGDQGYTLLPLIRGDNVITMTDFRDPDVVDVEWTNLTPAGKTDMRNHLAAGNVISDWEFD